MAIISELNPEEMRSEIFVNLLGYKEPNLLYLMRCKGQCSNTNSPLSCRATKVREKKVKMMLRSYLTGKEPVDKVKELILDEHEECGCQCSRDLAEDCAGRFNEVTCECECSVWSLGIEKNFASLEETHFGILRIVNVKVNLWLPEEWSWVTLFVIKYQTILVGIFAKVLEI